jgi:hypothetical protein
MHVPPFDKGRVADGASTKPEEQSVSQRCGQEEKYQEEQEEGCTGQRQRQPTRGQLSCIPSLFSLLLSFSPSFSPAPLHNTTAESVCLKHPYHGFPLSSLSSLPTLLWSLFKCFCLFSAICYKTRNEKKKTSARQRGEAFSAVFYA